MPCCQCPWTALDRDALSATALWHSRLIPPDAPLWGHSWTLPYHLYHVSACLFFLIFTVSHGVLYEHLPYSGALLNNYLPNQAESLVSKDHVEFIFALPEAHTELLPEGGMGESLIQNWHEIQLINFFQNLLSASVVGAGDIVVNKPALMELTSQGQYSKINK